MKRIFVLTVNLLLVAFSLYSQGYWMYNLDSLNLRHYESQYLLPEIMDNCADISLDVFPTEYETGFLDYMSLWNRGYLMLTHSSGLTSLAHSSWTTEEYHLLFNVNFLADFAQPFSSDTTITIVGVSGYIENSSDKYISSQTYFADGKFYLEIWDSTLTEVIRSVDVSDTTGRFIYSHITPHYTEVFFDSAINMNGKFYVVYHTPDSVLDRENASKVSFTSNVYATIFCEHDMLTYHSNMLPLRRECKQVSWLPFQTYDATHNYAADVSSFITMIYLFPILGEYDPNAEEWHGVGLNETRDISQFTHVFPNPASSEVNINCGYKIKTLQAFDGQGKLLFEKEVNAYNYQINLENYPTGTYLIKVLTNSGQATKKVIKE